VLESPHFRNLHKGKIFLGHGERANLSRIGAVAARRVLTHHPLPFVDFRQAKPEIFSLYEGNPPRQGNCEAQAPGNNTEREAQEGLKRLLTDCQSQQASRLRADGDRGEESQPREAKAGPDFPNPFFGIALKRDSEFSRHPASVRHAKEQHHGGSSRVSQPYLD
jgi:hypothetical protein